MPGKEGTWLIPEKNRRGSNPATSKPPDEGRFEAVLFRRASPE
jgi:hypothetical protein